MKDLAVHTKVTIGACDEKPFSCSHKASKLPNARCHGHYETLETQATKNLDKGHWRSSMSRLPAIVPSISLQIPPSKHLLSMSP